jgi:hypothetical protein
MRSAVRVIRFVTTLGLFAAAPIFACSSSNRVPYGAQGAEAGPAEVERFADGAAPQDVHYSSSEIWADDPPPQWCGPKNGGKKPADPGGTPECPGDKNKEGCPCDTVGESAPCWPGMRVNRGLGICQDGTTTCTAQGEFGRVWGACENFVLPDSNATKGKEACKCFSAGQWKLDNLSPCLITSSDGTYYANSDACQGPDAPPKTKPSVPWSKNTLKTDCAGHFKLCYAIKAGDAKAPSASDCTLTSVCTEADYLKADTVQSFPDLPAWLSTDSACVEKFLNQGGYGEMSVVGKSVLCDEVGDNGKPYVFQRTPYCPGDCPNRPNDADCKGCQNGGSGSF